MQDLFRNFSRCGVDYLLIGGQATVVYGAAQFTQDFDVWVRPTRKNLEALLRALSRSGARVHKLTPPVTVRNARRGHGFPFVVPSPRSAPVPLDVMGCPPRVGGFVSAKRRSALTATPWGRVPVVSAEDLVRLKRTNRPGDYEVIARLVRLRLDSTPRPSRGLLAWAVENTLDLEALISLVEKHAASIARTGKALPETALRLARRFVDGPPPSRADLLLAERDVLRRLSAAIRAGREYWIPILRELREMRTRGVLIPEGMAVRDLPGRNG